MCMIVPTSQLKHLSLALFLNFVQGRGSHLLHHVVRSLRAEVLGISLSLVHVPGWATALHSSDAELEHLLFL